jgi:hypothetical protein
MKAVPQQVALAILVNHLGDNACAVRFSQSFARKVVANLDNDWSPTTD